MKFNRIIQYGVIRSGSTFVYQALKILFPNLNVVKTHEFVDGEDPVVATIRDPRDCMVSAWRVFSLQITGPWKCITGEQDVHVDNSVSALEPRRMMTEEEVNNYFSEIERHFRTFFLYQAGCGSRLLMFRYEDFHVDDDILFDGISRFFGIYIDESVRRQILDLYSMEKNRERASRFLHFGEYGREHSIHGMHVFKGAIGGWREYVPEEFHSKVNSRFQPILDRFYNPDENPVVAKRKPKNRNFVLRYAGEHRERLRYSFKGAEMIEVNFSQAFQDMFVLSLLDGKRNGTYVEIGGNHPTVDNNTYLLETLFGWRGVAFDIMPKLVEEYNVARRNKCLCENALTVDYGEILRTGEFQNQIDYLQIDIEPARHTFEALKRVLLSGFRFSVITFETELYSNGPEVRNESREFLASNGYDLVIGDVSILGHPFEDWYVDPSVMNMGIVGLFRQQWAECEDCVLKPANEK